MKITKIESQRNKERVNIYLDGEFAFGILRELQFKHKLKENMEITQDYIDNIILEEEQIKTNNAALRFLSYRQRSEKEIRDKLKEKDFEEEFIDNTIVYLKENDLIDDLAFAKAFVKDKIHLNKHGPRKIRYDLYLKGISDSIIDKALEQDDTEYERALELAKKKMYSYRNDDRNAQYRKLGGFLQRRGYSSSHVYKILDKLIK